MKGHVRIYFEHFGHGIDDIILCESCYMKADDIHHLKYRSQGGKDEISNLMALCRDCHNDAHNEVHDRKYYQDIHNDYLKLMG